MTQEDFNKAIFGIQAIAEKAGMIGFVCSYVYKDAENTGNILSGGFAAMPTVTGDPDAVKGGLRTITEGMVNTAKDNAWKAYDNRIEAMALERAKAQAEAVAATSPADPAQPDPALEKPEA